FSLPAAGIARAVWIGVGIIGVLIVFGVATLLRHDVSIIALSRSLPRTVEINSNLFNRALQVVVGFALVLPVLGGGDALARVAREFAAPRLPALQRTTFFLLVFVLVIIVPSSFLFVALVPSAQASIWSDTPLSGLAQHLDLPAWAIAFIVLLVPVAALLILVPAANAALEDTDQLLRRLSTERILPEQLSRPSTTSGGGATSMSAAAAAAVLVTFASGAQVAWLSRAYGMAVAVTLLLKVAALVRLRRTHHEPRPFTAPFNIWLQDRELPVGLIAVGTLASLCALAMLLRADIPALAVMSLIVGLGLVLAARRKAAGSGIA